MTLLAIDNKLISANVCPKQREVLELCRSHDLRVQAQKLQGYQPSC